MKKEKDAPIKRKPQGQVPQQASQEEPLNTPSQRGPIVTRTEMQKAAKQFKDRPARVYEPGQEPGTPDYGRIGPIGPQEVEKAQQICQHYQDGKRQLEERIVTNEQWWRQRQWDLATDGTVNKINAEDPRPISAWMFNSLANKHADIMDNYPTSAVLPREQNDEADAKMITQILPVIMERNGYKRKYSKGQWYKLKHGTNCQWVGWDSSIDNGIGDIDVENVDLLNIWWEPGITDIERSQNVFTANYVDTDDLIAQYPYLADKAGGTGNFTIKQYIEDDTVDNSGKTTVFDWYYKRHVDSREILCFCKFACGQVIFASENVAEYAERGFYDHHKYPFVFDTLFPMEGNLCGFGYIDIMKDPQMYIDKLNQIIMKNALLASKPRYFVREGAGVNEDEFTNMSVDIVHTTGSIDNTKIQPIQVQSVPSFIVQHQQDRIDELKETSGNRDFSQGSTSSGVTAASAIAALQEAGSKLSRDIIANSYMSFTDISYISLELIRQFYDESRFFRITGEGTQGPQYEQYDNTNIKDWNQEKIALDATGQDSSFIGDDVRRVPIFDIKIVAEKENPFNRASQNETAKELFQLGAFNPQMSDQSLIMLDMMQFEGKDQIIEKVEQNQQLIMQMQQMQQQIQQLQEQLGQALKNSDAMEGMITGQPGNTMDTAAAAGVIPPDQSQSTPDGQRLESARETARNMAKQGDR